MAGFDYERAAVDISGKVDVTATATAKRSPVHMGGVVATTVWNATATGALNVYFPIPDDYASGDITFKFRVQPSIADGLIAWRKSVYRLRNGVAIATIEANTNIDSTPLNTLPVEISVVVLAANFAAGDVIRVDLTRLGADASDTMSNNVNYNGAWVEYTRRVI